MIDPDDRRWQAEHETDLWDRYHLKLLVDHLTAGIPANPKLMEAWLETNKAPEGAALDQEVMVSRLDPEETHAVVFYRDVDGKPCFESRNMKAALREGANILKGMLGVQNLRSKLAERVFVGPRLVPITTTVALSERPISVMTMRGPRTSIKRFEYADNVPLEFNVKILKDKVIKPEHLRTILEYMQDGGIGSDRSQGSGTYQLVEFKPV